MPVMKFDVNETYAPNPRTTAKGHYIVHISIDKEGNEKPPSLLADKFDIVGNGTDGSGAHYRIIRYQDRCTRQTRHAALPCAEIGSNAAWAKLQGMGIVVYSGRVKREYLADYLQTAGSRDFWQITDKAGWQGNAYILPSGEVLQADEGECRVLYNGDTSQAAAYTSKGSLHEWRENVAKYAAGNSRLLLAIGAALAAPMMNRLEEAGGGFHLYGASRDGKTTAAKAALSVWGDPDAAKLSWNGTALGFGNTALARNDNLLVLDEIGQVKHAKTVSETAYAVIDGTGKIQGHKDGGNRLIRQWRTLLFSTGEYDMQSYVERGGEKWEAGQNVRIPSLPSRAIYGIYENLHGFKDGAALSDHLLHQIGQYHGTAGRAWIEKLRHTDTAAIRETRDSFLQMLPELNGQILTVARRFALVAAALELSADITGLPRGQGMAAMKQYFEEWIDENGTESHEERTIIRNAVRFFELYAHTPRFAIFDALQKDHDRNHAGYYKAKNGDYAAPAAEREQEYWVIPTVFEEEICKGRNTAMVCRILHGAGWLEKYSGERYQFQRGDKIRYYVFDGVRPPDK